jgi:hypothetical protein
LKVLRGLVFEQDDGFGGGEGFLHLGGGVVETTGDFFQV